MMRHQARLDRWCIHCERSLPVEDISIENPGHHQVGSNTNYLLKTLQRQPIIQYPANPILTPHLPSASKLTSQAKRSKKRHNTKKSNHTLKSTHKLTTSHLPQYPSYNHRPILMTKLRVTT
jgi:hypothetical protein